MKKKYIYIFIASLALILIFSLAASCNMCGISLTEKTEEEELSSDGSQSQGDETQNGASQVDWSGSEDETSPQDDDGDSEYMADDDADDEGDAEVADEDFEEEEPEDEEDLPEVEPEEEEPAVAWESLRSFGINSSISGQIAEDRSVFFVSDSSGAPALYIGDTASAMLVKGFLSFDISEIDGDNVLNAWLNLNSSRVGNPPSLMGIFSVNYTNYGNTLEGDDWGRVSSAIFSSPLSNTDFSFTNDALRNAVQDALDEGRQYFQVKLSTQNANGNGAADGFTFMASNISLEVSYN